MNEPATRQEQQLTGKVTRSDQRQFAKMAQTSSKMLVHHHTLSHSLSCGANALHITNRANALAVRQEGRFSAIFREEWFLLTIAENGDDYHG